MNRPSLNMTLRALLLGAAASLSAVPDVSLAQDRAAALNDVVVTGSLIRGVNAATPVETVRRTTVETAGVLSLIHI